MEKLKRLIIGLVFIGVVLLIGKRLIYGPSVKLSERKTVSNFVENYYTKKYGNHSFKVTSIEYDYKRNDMGDMFNYSNPIGYRVVVKSDAIKKFNKTVLGTVPGKYEFMTDTFVWDYYFPNLGSYSKNIKQESIIPTKKIEEDLLNKIKEEFDSTIQTIECSAERLNIPDDFGKIPTMEELKNDINLYEVIDFNYTQTAVIEIQDDYKTKLQAFLSNNLGGDWNVFFNPKGSITCIKDN